MSVYLGSFLTLNSILKLQYVKIFMGYIYICMYMHVFLIEVEEPLGTLLFIQR